MFTIFANIFKTLLRGRNKTIHTGNYTPIGFWLEKKLKHQEFQAIKQQQIGDLQFYYRRPYELLKTYREIFGAEIYRFTTNEANPIILDCGANIGLASVYFKSLYPTATIIAFEPDASNREIFQKNITANQLEGITIQAEAIWIKDGFIQFESAATEASKISENATNTVSVPCIDFKKMLEQFSQIDFLKMDIEGAEFEVLKHCSNSLHHVKNIFLEYHGYTSKPEELSTLLSILSAQGFTYYIRNAADPIAFPYEYKEEEKIYNVQLNIFLTKKQIHE
jgi:FkbM family methyltransferase